MPYSFSVSLAWPRSRPHSPPKTPPTASPSTHSPRPAPSSPPSPPLHSGSSRNFLVLPTLFPRPAPDSESQSHTAHPSPRQTPPYSSRTQARDTMTKRPSQSGPANPATTAADSP